MKDSIAIYKAKVDVLAWKAVLHLLMSRKKNTKPEKYGTDTFVRER